MRYIEFGRNKRKASEIVAGLWRIKDLTTEQVNELLCAADESGINFLDIADIYKGGICETLLGRTFQQFPGLRDRFILQSKCGIRKDGVVWYDFSKEHILEAVDASLARLQTDHLDCLLLHRPDALMEMDEIAEAFEILDKAGKVLDFGVSNMNPMMMELMRTYVPFPIATNQVQLSCAYTPMIDAGIHVNMHEDAGIMYGGSILEYSKLHDVCIQTWSSMQYGNFGGVFIGSEKYPELNKVLERIAEEKNVTPTAVALAWLLRYPLRMQAVIGTTKPFRMRESAAACDFELTKREWYEIYQAAGNVLP